MFADRNIVVHGPFITWFMPFEKVGVLNG